LAGALTLTADAPRASWTAIATTTLDARMLSSGSETIGGGARRNEQRHHVTGEILVEQHLAPLGADLEVEGDRFTDALDAIHPLRRPDPSSSLAW
jgi:hypothetical protein